MNLPDARRELNELRAAHTEQPEPLPPLQHIAMRASSQDLLQQTYRDLRRNEDVAFQARTETVNANAAVLADVLVALVEMEPLVTRAAPAGVVMGTGRRRKWYPTSEPVTEWRAQGYETTDPRVGIVGQPAPFTLPARPRQTFGDVA